MRGFFELVKEIREDAATGGSDWELDHKLHDLCHRYSMELADGFYEMGRRHSKGLIKPLNDEHLIAKIEQGLNQGKSNAM